jgi:7-cyano-7-deazaguanine synthase
MSVVTLVSGGLDSALLALFLKEERVSQYSCFIDYGQLAREQEWSACRKHHRQFKLRPPERIDLAGFGETIKSGLTTRKLHVKRDAFLPGRNLLFLVTAGAYALRRRANAIAIGLLNDEHHLFPDQTVNFLQEVERTLEVALGKKLRILAPLMMFNKPDIVSLAEERGIRYSYSCHAGRPKPCGKCISCLEYVK